MFKIDHVFKRIMRYEGQGFFINLFSTLYIGIGT